jgi:hypothetical protein
MMGHEETLGAAYATLAESKNSDRTTACGTRIVDWGVPRCGNLNIAALLSGVVCDIRVT